MHNQSYPLLVLTVAVLCLVIPATPCSNQDMGTFSWAQCWQVIENMGLKKTIPHLFRITDLYERYKSSTKTICEDNKYCVMPMLEITNFENSKEYIMKLPTVLVMAGTDGRDQAGIDSVYNFLKMISKDFMKNSFYSRILNNLRILVIPMANPSGFTKGVIPETQEVAIDSPIHKQISPIFDFNWRPQNMCFRSSIAQILNQVFQDNLIVGVLDFAWGSPSISYPANPLSGNLMENQEMFESFASMMQEAAGSNEKLKLQRFRKGTFEDLKLTKVGNFEKWASQGSLNKENLDHSCLIRTSVFSSEFLKIGENTNRAVVFRVESQIDPEKDNEDNKMRGQPSLSI